MTPANLDLKIYHGITFGPMTIACKDAAGAAVDLTGWLVYAQARVSFRTPAFDLLPTISDEAGGVITILLTDEQTFALPVGNFRWDLILENPAGEKLGPYFGGRAIVQQINTQVGGALSPGTTAPDGATNHIFFTAGDPNGVITAIRPAFAYDETGAVWFKTGEGATNTGWERAL